MKAALYIRVSTMSQTTVNQRRELEAYCQRQGWSVVKVYDDTVSGSKVDRPALNQLLKDASTGKWDVVCVWKIDRLARSTAHLLAILTELTAAGVNFVATTQAIDTTSSYGRMVVTFLGAIAQFERETIVERVRSGLARARAQGVRIGRPRVAIDIRRALELRAAGLGVKLIARKLGVPRSTLHRALQGIPKPVAA